LATRSGPSAKVSNKDPPFFFPPLTRQRDNGASHNELPPATHSPAILGVGDGVSTLGKGVGDTTSALTTGVGHTASALTTGVGDTVKSVGDMAKSKSATGGIGG
jgi:hypothetical protein